jgi:predicted DNA-binding transcriptional regulator AlpA
VYDNDGIREIVRDVIEELGLLPRYLTAREAAEMTGFSVKSLEHRRERGLPPRYVRVGRSVRYRVDDLRDWIEGDAPR